MRNRFIRTSAALVLGLSLVGAACTDDEETADETTTTAAAEDTTTTAAEDEMPAEDQTIVDIAAGDSNFSTVVPAATEAGLVETLSGEGPFTVFAPTNEAFEALPEGTLDALLEDPTGALTDVLGLHVISGTAVDAEAATAAAGTCVETLGGQVKVEATDTGLSFGGANIVQTDIMASNGVIHVIDAVVAAESTDC
jgi:uncharacterized surface protein with fasciclin (FAS1) repeats